MDEKLESQVLRFPVPGEVYPAFTISVCIVDAFSGEMHLEKLGWGAIDFGGLVKSSLDICETFS